MSRQLWAALIVFALLLEPIATKRGGGGGGFGRGGGSAGRSSSAGRWSGGGASRGTNPASRSGGGWTGGHQGQTRTGGGAWNKGHYSGGHGSSSYSRGPSRYKSGSGIGSVMRGSTFKNMVVGAAAGYLTYQAGKALIRNLAAPMMWNNRPYYWGQSYYRPPSGGGHMCHMPIDPNDPQLGNIYANGNERPKEIAWGCGNHEVCCGYECCPAGGGGQGGYGGGGYGGGWWNGGSRIGFGSILVLLLFCACGAFVAHQICKARRSGGGGPFMSNNKYSRGEAVYTGAPEPPPQYQPPPNTYPPPPQPRQFT